MPTHLLAPWARINESAMAPIELQIWILTVLFIALVFFICYQTWRLGEFYLSGDGKRSPFSTIEVAAWVVLLLYRLYGIWTLSDQIALAKKAGLIRDNLTGVQWVGFLGNILFLVLIIISKHRERQAIKRAWGQ